MKALVEFKSTYDGWGLQQIERDFKDGEEIYLAAWGDTYASAKILWLEEDAADLAAEKEDEKRADEMIANLGRKDTP